MRDLGVDCALGRCRRVKLQKARFRRGAHRNKKLGALKIPQPRINLRLFRGGVSSAMLWGSPCPSRREYLRTRPSRQLARHKFGHIDVVYDEIDLTTQQVEAWFKVLQRWKGDATALERGWGHTWQRLAKDNRWASVKGPFAATVAYLQDLKLDLSAGKRFAVQGPRCQLRVRLVEGPARFTSGNSGCQDRAVGNPRGPLTLRGSSLLQTPAEGSSPLTHACGV